jgi:phage terminase large subunit
MELEIRHTSVFSKNYEALLNPKIRFVINQGSSRSSKSFSLSQLVIVYCLYNPGKSVSVCRRTLPSLRETAMKDIFELLHTYGLYNEKDHNKTRNIFTFKNGSTIEFFSLDDSQKVRGRKRDLLWLEEANEVDRETFVQLNIRTTEKVFASFNPSDSEHYLYDIIEKEDAILVHSTYKDNPFLPDDQVKEIEDLINIDIDYYNIYALGLPSKSNHTVFNHQKVYIDDLPSYNETILGLDFGFQHPTALIECNFREDIVYCKELIYESHLTSEDLVSKMNNIFLERGWSKSMLIVADYARPELIEDLRRNGFNVQNAIKNVKEGIDAVKTYKLFYHHQSINLAREFRNYKWKSQGERLLDEPVKLWDDAMDALRYSVLYHKKHYSKNVGGYDFISF